MTTKRSALKTVMRNMCLSVLRLGFRQADVLAACSRQAGIYMYGHRSTPIVFYNGIVLDKFVSARHLPVEELCKKYAINPNEKNFVVVARMTDQKNPFFLLDIVSELIRYYPNIKLMWVGTGELSQDIEKYIKKKNLQTHVNILGVQTKVFEILSCCDYFLLPSKMEGAPLVLIEAQAAGLMCFASDRVPNIIDCGAVSFIELDKTAEEWAAEIHWQIENEPKAKVNEALLQRFDVNETVKALSEVYDRLVES